MAGMNLNFMSVLTLFQSYQDNGKMIMKMHAMEPR